jgi:hypothetical protein
VAADSRDIANYQNAVLIGRGGFGSVYRAVDADHGREVAIKVLQGTLGDTERRRFDRERKTMGRLGGHPNIIPVHDSGYTDDDEAYLVMELATGGSLRQRLDTQGPIPWPEAVELVSAIADAVQVAHDQGVLHRDIKPDNILIDRFDNPRLSDFGIAAVASNATATTSMATTIAHAAPEILEGHKPSEAADIYALGSTFHNLVTGLPPFVRPGDESTATILARTLREPPPDIRRHGVPDAVARVAERALAKTPTDRQPSAGQLAADLRAATANQGPADPIPPGAPGAADRPGAAERGVPAAFVAGGGPAGVVVAPSVGGGGTLAEGPTIAAQPGPAVLTTPDVVAGVFTPGSAPMSSAPGSAPIMYGPAGGDTGPSPRSRRPWLVVAALAMILIALGAVVVVGDLGSSRSTGEAATGAGASDPDGEPAGPTVASDTSAPAGGDGAASSATASTTAPEAVESPLVERQLAPAAVATASSEAESGVDACGAPTSYRAANVLDGQTTTAWRTPGDGDGEWIEVTLDDSYLVTSVGLVPGYAKQDACDGADRFVENRRIEEVRWTVGDRSLIQRLDPDRPELQVLSLAEPLSARTIRLEIVRTTPSGGRDFTAISDIEIVGG